MAVGEKPIETPRMLRTKVRALYAFKQVSACTGRIEGEYQPATGRQCILEMTIHVLI